VFPPAFSCKYQEPVSGDIAVVVASLTEGEPGVLG
jgi:hypothetical protein